MNGCSERCGHCGRCSSGYGRERHGRRLELTREDHAAISQAWHDAGIGRDYLGWADRVYLRQQGKTADQIITIGIEMADRDRRLQEQRAAVGK